MKTLQDYGYDYRFIYTAQHKTTVENLINNFKIKKPDFTVVKWEEEAKTLKLFLGFWLLKVFFSLFFKSKKILPFKKGIVITHGDTTSAVWGALLGKLTRNKVMHLESGLRSFNILSPFPEELNRLITFYLTDIYACPNQWAVDNLKKFKGIKLNTENNTQIDSLRIALDNINKISFKTPDYNYAVISIHRYENIFSEKRLNEIVEIINNVADTIKCIFVLHPATEKQLDKYGLTNKISPNVKFSPRLDFFEFVKLFSKSEFVITDGGSNQEELSYIGKPTLILRNYTERNEGLNRNAVLSKFDHNVIDNFIHNYQAYSYESSGFNGSPSLKIFEWLKNNYL